MRKNEVQVCYVYPVPVLHVFRITHASEVAGLQFALNERNRMEALC